MISLSARVQGNTVTVSDDALRKYSGIPVLITITEKKQIERKTLERQLDMLRTSTTSSWGEDAQAYISGIRASDRVF